MHQDSSQRKLLLRFVSLALAVIALVVSPNAFGESPKKKIIKRLGTGGSVSSSRAKSSAKKKPVAQKPEGPASETATSELAVPVSEQSKDILPTPATVSSTIEPVADPIDHRSFQLGVMAELYQPMGTVRLPSLATYELTSLRARPMVSGEVHWLPLDFEVEDRLPGAYSAGIYASIGYALHDVKLSSPAGQAIEGTELHTLKVQAGTELAWARSMGSPWGVRLQAGVGQLQLTQSSSSSYATTAGSVRFANLALVGERRIFERWSLVVGYDHRVPLQGGSTEKDESVFGIQRSNVTAGILGGFQ